MGKMNKDNTKKTRNTRPYSFSIEPELYNKYMEMCRERGVIASASIRRLMYLQMKTWARGDSDQGL